jgi:8-oxo-dGTP pyrophosphatase MutT (NUDIX family)
MSPQFRKVAEETIFDGYLIRVASTVFEAPDGTHLDREIVHHPGAVVVVAVTGDRKAVMVRQFRAAVGDDLLEVPAGKRDVDGEPTEVTASRELAEEVGRRAGRLELMARFYNSPGFTDEFTWLYLAQDLEEVPLDRQGLEEQHMTIVEVPLDDVPRLIEAGELVDAKSIIGLTLAAARVPAP